MTNDSTALAGEQINGKAISASNCFCHIDPELWKSQEQSSANFPAEAFELFSALLRRFTSLMEWLLLQLCYAAVLESPSGGDRPCGHPGGSHEAGLQTCAEATAE